MRTRIAHMSLRTGRFLLLALALLSTLSVWATDYNNTATELVTGETNGQQVYATVYKLDDHTTRLVYTSPTSTLVGVYQRNIENAGGGTNAQMQNVTVNDGVITFDIHWDTYPTSELQLYVVVYRSQASGGGDIICTRISNVNASYLLTNRTTFYYVNTNVSGWATPYVYAWDGATNNGAFPGVAMTPTDDYDDCGARIWSYSFDEGLYTNCIFSDNGSSQTATATIVADKYYVDGTFYTTLPERCQTLYYVNSNGYSQPYVYMWNGSANNGTFPGQKMHNTGLTDPCGNAIYEYSYLKNAYTQCIFSDGTTAHQTSNLTVNAGKYYSERKSAWAASTAQLCTDPQNTDSTQLTPDLTLNLALNRPVHMGNGSTDKGSNDGNRASLTNAWNGPSNSWWYVELAQVYDVRRINIFWEGAYSTDYVIQCSETLPSDPTNDNQWSTIYATGSGFTPHVGQADADANVYDVIIAAKYIRIKFNDCLNTGWGVKMWEVEVYGLPVDWCKGVAPTYTGPTQNLALDKCAYAGREDGAGYAAAKAVDGDYNSYLSTNNGTHMTDDWLYVNLDAQFNLTEVKLFWTGSYSDNYLIQTASADPEQESSWTTRRHITGTQQTGTNANTIALEAYARYVRVKSLHNPGGNGMEIREMEVYAGSVAPSGTLSKPVITTAVVQDRQLTETTLSLAATQGTHDIHGFHIVDAAHSIDEYVYSTTGTYTLPLDGIQSYSLTVTAVGLDGQLSTPTVVTVGNTTCAGFPATFTGTTQNLALNRCSYGPAGTTPANANDGSINTRYHTQQVGGLNHPADDWWYVNLDAVYNLSQVKISFDQFYPTDFLIQVAVSEPTVEADWRTVHHFRGTPSINSGSGMTLDTYDVIDNYAQYVRIKAVTPHHTDTDDGIDFWEVEVYGLRFATDAALNAPILSSAAVSSIGTSDVTFSMTATQDDRNVHRYHLVDAHNGIDTVIYAADDEVTLSLPQNRHYDFTVTAIGFDGAVSNSINVEVEMPYQLVYNIALNKPATSGYEAYENTVFKAILANDGYLNTRWGTNDNRAQDFYCPTCEPAEHPDIDWWIVDLGEEYRLTEIQIFWELAASYDYVVEVSIDSINWTTIAHEVFSGVGDDTPKHTAHTQPAVETDAMVYALADEPARYVRIANQGETTCYDDCIYGISIWEVRVYGSNYHVPAECTWSGEAGSGSRGNGNADKFIHGYNLTIGKTATGDSIYVDFISYDTERTGIANAVFQEFVVEDVMQNTSEYKYLKRDASNPLHFFGAIPYDHSDPHWTNTAAMTDWQNRQTVRVAVKYEYAAEKGSKGFSITDPVYYQIGVGCAPDTFYIYHHDDKLIESSRTEYEGGKILQPIVYRRKFVPDTWETLYLPFEVDHVTTDDNGVEYPLLAQVGTEDAGYWLCKFNRLGDGVAVTQPDFKPNWEFAGTTKPQKNIPYIMMVPGDGDGDPSDDWYATHYVNFYGKGYQTINGSFSLGAAPGRNAQDEPLFLYYGNTTMKTQYIGDAYVISSDGLWFENSEWTGRTQNTLYPFECYVLSDPITMTTVRKLALNAKQQPQQPEVATDLPSTGQGELQCLYHDGQLTVSSTVTTDMLIYAVDGRLVARVSLTEGEQTILTIARGAYVLATQYGVQKICF